MASRKRSASPKRRRSKSRSRKKSRIYSASRPLNLKKNSLSKHGYSTKTGVTARHAALKKAIHMYGSHVVWSKLNLISILNKNRSPATSTIMTRDKNWVKREFL